MGRSASVRELLGKREEAVFDSCIVCSSVCTCSRLYNSAASESKGIEVKRGGYSSTVSRAVEESKTISPKI